MHTWSPEVVRLLRVNVWDELAIAARMDFQALPAFPAFGHSCSLTGSWNGN